MFVLKRIDKGGGFVAPAGGYCDRLKDAREYETREEAERDKQHNEVVVDVYSLLVKPKMYGAT